MDGVLVIVGLTCLLTFVCVAVPNMLCSKGRNEGRLKELANCQRMLESLEANFEANPKTLRGMERNVKRAKDAKYYRERIEYLSEDHWDLPFN